MIAFFPSRTIAVAWGSAAIHWYGIMYAVAFWVAYAMLPYLGRLRGIQRSRDQWTILIVYGALGVLLGGRLGYALLYEPAYFISHPLQLFAIWGGGMSSHGGFIGVAIAVWLWVKTSSPTLLLRKEKGATSSFPLLTKERLGEVLKVADIITIPAAIGLALGRVGNIINQEFGIYPYYEVIGDVVIAMICYALLRAALTPSRSPLYKGEKQGTVIAIFLILYSIERFLLEYIRPQEWPYIFGLTRGQFLTIPIFIIGMLLFLYARTKQRTKISR